MKNLTRETRGESGDRMTTPAREIRAIRGPRVIARDRVIAAYDQVTQCPDVPITGSSDHQVTRSPGRLFYAFGTLLAALREIFDENAYERFLVRTQALRSIASYRKFLREREAEIARKPRCC